MAVGDVKYFHRTLEADLADHEEQGWSEWGRETLPSLPNDPIVFLEWSKPGEPKLPSDEDRKTDPVNRPSHYTSHPSGVECIAIVEHFPFNIGAAIKYLWRCGLKGDAIEDLEKARWMITREIERRKQK